MGLGKLGALLTGLALTASVFTVVLSYAVDRDYDWAEDPRSFSLTTEGLEDLLPPVPEPQSGEGFGELLGEWTWADLRIPGDWAGAGLSIDYPYLYLSNQDYHRVYVIDVSTGRPIPLLWFDAPGVGVTWGLGMDNDKELWVGDIWDYEPRHSWAYEMTSYPPTPNPTGNSFNSYQGARWMADLTDNVPYDTVYTVRLGWAPGLGNNIYAFHEPSGQVGRNFGDTTWTYVSQRALAYNDDDGTLFVGGWNSNKMWEISMSDGAPLPGRSFYAVYPAGAAYQNVATGGPCLWVQSNEYISVLRKYRTVPVDSCSPVEPWRVRTQGYWRRQCKDKPHEDICAYVDSIHILIDLFDAFDCDSVCNLMKVIPPERDMCRKAKRQFMAVLLNVASDKLAVCNCLEDGREVADVIADIDSLLSGSPDFATCEYAKTLADGINNGIGIVPCDTAWTIVPPKSILSPSISVAPNPFSTSTVIEYEFLASGHVKLQIYDKAGRLVRTLVDGGQKPGLHQVQWNGLNESGCRIPNGIYIIRLETRSSITSERLVLLH